MSEDVLIPNPNHPMLTSMGGSHGLELVLRHTGDLIWGRSLSFELVFYSDTALRASGYSTEEIESLPLADHMTPESAARALQALQLFREQIAAGFPPGPVSRRIELEMVRKDGGIHWVDFLITLIRTDGGEPLGFLGVGRDITDRREAEEALRLSEERYALACEGAQEGLWDWDMVRNQVYRSARWLEILGYPKGHQFPEGASPWPQIHPDDRPLFFKKLDAHLEGQTDHLESEHRIRHVDGGWRWVLVRGTAVRDEAGKPRRIAGSMGDLTRRKELEEELRFGAFHDGLTRLPNRALFVDRLEHNVTMRARDKTHAFSVLFFDLDGFKAVNDQHGHSAGDEILCKVGESLSGNLRPADTLARMGGDEFAVLLEGSGASVAMAVARRLLSRVCRPFSLGGQTVLMSASIGVTSCETRDKSSESMVREADAAMYAAKREGKGRVVLWAEGLERHPGQVEPMPDDLESAVRGDALRLLYQPVFSLLTGEVIGAEALVRWAHPRHGLLPPSAFLHVAEEAGLILPLGRKIFEAACAQVARWVADDQCAPDFSVSVNVSPLQVRRGRLAETLTEILSEFDLDPWRIRVEVAERVLMTTPGTVHRELSTLAAMGARVDLDNFGTGYSSLTHLHRFPFDAVKVDRSFVSGAHGEREHEFVRSVVGVARSLGLDVVAEGVETEAQLDLVRAAGCTRAQGFHLGKPMPPAQFDFTALPCAGGGSTR